MDPELLKTECAGNRHVGCAIRVLATAASTNDLCHEAAVEPGNAGLAIFAEQQSSGRGQHGRAWSAPAGSSLLFSVLLFPPERMARPEFLTAWSALALATRFREDFHLDCRIKWPNDLLIEGRKVCGILVERRVGTVVGIGLNVSIRPDQFPRDLRLPATSLETEVAAPVDRAKLAVDLLRSLDESFDNALERGPSELYDRWVEHAEDFGAEPIVATTRHTRVDGHLVDLRPDRGARVMRSDGSVARIPPEELLRVERAPRLPTC